MKGRRSLGALAMVVVVVGLLAVTACRDKSTQDPPKLEVSSAVNPKDTSSGPPPVTSVPVLVEVSVDARIDAGATATEEHHRRRVPRGADAGAMASAEPAATAEASASATFRVHTPPRAMGDDTPYGGAPSASANPVLKKTPLESEDPWARPASSAR